MFSDKDYQNGEERLEEVAKERLGAHGVTADAQKISKEIVEDLRTGRPRCVVLRQDAVDRMEKDLTDLRKMKAVIERQVERRRKGGLGKT